MAANERYRQASRITTRHEIRTAEGEWLPVDQIVTFTGPIRFYEYTLGNGDYARVTPDQDVMSRLRPKGGS